MLISTKLSSDLGFSATGKRGGKGKGRVAGNLSGRKGPEYTGLVKALIPVLYFNLFITKVKSKNYY